MILVSEADIFFTESLRILAERLSQSENGLPLRQICYYSPPEDVGVFSTEIKTCFKSNIDGYDSLLLCLQKFNPLLDTADRLFLAKHFHDLGRTCRRHLLAGYSGTDRPHYKAGLNALFGYILGQRRVQGVVGVIFLCFQNRQNIF